MADDDNKTGGDAPKEPSDIRPVTIAEEMRRSYLDYAMSVIVSRALPDVRDGLKPVHRRILYAMHNLNLAWNRKHMKSSKVVGDTMGDFHPHGNTAIYDALARLAQDFSMRVPLIDGQGNFGSVDGDPPAAERYTEARLSKVAQYLLDDLDKDTVDFKPNYDDRLQEPSVLPAKFPNLLVNGAGGIAVGMATNIPPHNLGEVIDACILLLDNPETTIDDLCEVVRGPDFPTGGLILGRAATLAAYHKGRGAIIMRAKVHVEEIRKDREALIVTAIPYQVNKRTLIEKIAEQVREKKIEGISDLWDESNREGMRIVIELKRDAVSDVVLNQLWRFYRPPDIIRRQHDRAQRRPAGAADLARHADRLRRLPRGSGDAADQVSARQGPCTRAHRGRPRHLSRQHRGSDPPDPWFGVAGGSEGSAQGSRLARQGHGAADRAHRRSAPQVA